MKVPTVTRSPLSHRSVGGFFSKTGSEIFFENRNRLYSAGCNLLKIICFVSLWGEVSRIGKIIAKGVAFCIWTIQVYAYMYTYMCTYMFDFHRMNGSQSYENIPVPWILWGWNLWVMFLNQRCGEEIISPWVLVSIIFYVQRRSLGRSFYGMPQKPGSDEWWNLIRQGKT